jgi:3-phenylpropionate/trans-cinnamate dioxygenase ferredoxin reductase subunit
VAARLRTIAIVGASLAGLRAAEALRERGYEGRLVWIGAEPHEPYDRPPLSKQVLRGEWEPERIALARGGLDGLGAELRLGVRAQALDAGARRLQLADGLVIATGAVPRGLPGQPPLAGVFVLRTLDDALAIRTALAGSPRVAVVGGGFLGAEVAASCRQRGLDVTLIEALGQPLELALGSELGALFAGLHRDHGVQLASGAPVAALEGAGGAAAGPLGDNAGGAAAGPLGDKTARVERVRLADGRTIAADVVVVAIGVRPATDWLEGSGLTLRDGVVCDARCQAAPGIVAAGDVARWPHPRHGELRIEHWSHAAEQAAAAVVTLLDGAAAPPFAPVPYVWSDQYDTTLVVAGRPRAGDELRVIEGSLAERRFLALFGRAGKLTGAAGIGLARRLLPWRRALAEDLSFAEALARARH